MTEIDKAYDKIDKETTKSYEIKKKKLQKEEDDLKDKLKNNVTKIKEQLEIAISEANNLIKINEKIIKGVKSLEKEEKIMIKILSYISQMNKSQKEMKKLFRQLMKNLKISFIEEKSQINYEDYYFNGIPKPKNIEFKDISTNSVKISWNIDDINILNLDKKELKFRIEIKKENENKDFIQVYEGKENNFIVNKLEKNTVYKIQICSIYEDLASDWSEIHKIKTSNIDSNILNESERGNEFLEKLYEWIGCNKMELLYRGTRDGSRSNIFHNKCDNKGPTIILCKNEKDNIFGGYSSISWTTNIGYKSANGSFLFTLTNIHNTPPTKFPNTQNENCAVYHNSGYGPTFGNGHDLYISDDHLNNNSSYSHLCNDYSYPDILGKGYSIFTSELNNHNFKLKEVEIFKIIN